LRTSEKFSSLTTSMMDIRAELATRLFGLMAQDI
jgi:hypothetical protein